MGAVADGGWAGAIAEGSEVEGAWGFPGTAEPGATGGVAGVTPGVVAPAGGFRTVVVAAWSRKGNNATARPIRQKPKTRKDTA